MELKDYYINCEATRYGLAHVEAHDQDEAIKRLHDAYEKGIVRPECLKPAILRLRDDTDIYPNSGRVPDITLWYDTEIEKSNTGYVNDHKVLAKELINFLAHKGISQWDWVSIKEQIDGLLPCQRIMPITDQ